MKYQLSAVNLCVFGVICAAASLQLVNCLDPPRFQVSALPQDTYRYGTGNTDVVSIAPMNCIATVMDLQFYQSQWFVEMPDGSEIKLDQSDARILIQEGASIVPEHQGTAVTISNLSYLDNGTYRCEIQENDASGKAISEGASAMIRLLLEVRLESVDVNSTVHTFNDSQFVELGCDMSGYIRPDKDLFWVVNGAPLDPATNADSKYRVSYRNGTNVAQFGGSTTIPSRVAVLTILDVSLADSGAYSCAINNTNLMNQVQLEVIPASKPSGYPQDVRGIAISSTSLQISWNEVPDTERNGNITHYEILYTPINSTFLEQQPRISTTEGPVLDSVLQGLEEFTGYNISVRAVTIVGSGPLSPPQMNQTFEDVPSAPPQNLVIVSLDKNSLQVNWERPEPNDINGVLRLFKMEYCSPIRGIGNTVMTDCNQLDVNGTENGVLLTSLKEGTTYSVSVAAFTVGPGPAAMGSAKTKVAQLPLEPERPNPGTIAGAVIGVILAVIAVVVIASIVIGFIIRSKLSRRQHKQIPSSTVESQPVATVVETVRAPSPNLLPVSVSTENHSTLDRELVGEEITVPITTITSNGSLKKPTNISEEEEEEEEGALDVSVQPKLELTELLKDEPPQYNLFDPTPPSETADTTKEVAQEESETVVELNLDDGAVHSAHKDDIDSPVSMGEGQGTDTKQELMELLQNDDRDSS